MPCQEICPRVIAECTRAIGRADEVREQDRREHTVADSRRAQPGEELLDLVDDVVGLPERDVRVARQLDEPRTRDVLGDVTTFLHARIAVVAAMNDQRRRLHGRQDTPDIGL